MKLSEIHVSLTTHVLTRKEIEEVTHGDEVFVAVVHNWVDGGFSAVQLQRARSYWHTAYTHDTTYETTDIVEMMQVRTELVKESV